MEKDRSAPRDQSEYHVLQLYRGIRSLTDNWAFDNNSINAAVVPICPGFSTAPDYAKSREQFDNDLNTALTFPPDILCEATANLT